jgi:hypothetical protein
MLKKVLSRFLILLKKIHALIKKTDYNAGWKRFYTKIPANMGNLLLICGKCFTRFFIEKQETILYDRTEGLRTVFFLSEEVRAGLRFSLFLRTAKSRYKDIS